MRTSLISRIDELASGYDRPLSGEILCTRLDTGATEGSTPERKQLGLQLMGRLMAEDGNSGDDGTFGVFVAGILPGSVAANDGSIRVGDELLQVAAHFV